MKLYHGTEEHFEDFKLPYECVRHEYYGPALYFSSNYDVAKYYGSRIIEIEIPDSAINVHVDAKDDGMKFVAGVREMVNNEGIIAVENVCDYNLEGAQTKAFDVTETEFGEYKYFCQYNLENRFYKTKKEFEAETQKLDKAGVPYKTSYDKILRKYSIYTLKALTEEQAMAAFDAGANVKKIMRLTPETATTVIFAGEKALEILNSAKNAGKRG